MQKKQQTNGQAENNKDEQEVLDFDSPIYVFKPNDRHGWIQQGPYLICKTCELDHATYIGIDKHLMGLDEKGQPILEKVSIA